MTAETKNILFLLGLLVFSFISITFYTYRHADLFMHALSTKTITISGHAYVVDGDSLVIKNTRIRLLGIDAPELKQKCKISVDSQQVYACGKIAKKFLKNLIREQIVSCYSPKKDKYKRLLAECWVEKININRTMIEQGWAVSYGKYQGIERIARQNKKGLWAKGTFLYPQIWRKIHSK